MKIEVMRNAFGFRKYQIALSPKENMKLDEAIKIVCVKNELTIAEIARRLDVSPQALGQKLKRGKLSITDIDSIASVCGCQLECNFVLAGGERVPIVGRSMPE